jgi:glycosyltransferase involved in cell wall biosynthesis
MTVKFSIITVVYNRVGTIEQCIMSLLRQEFDVEYIVVDGGSTDGTIDILNRFSTNITHFISEKDSGIYDALNKGIALSTGDIIGVLHSDDTYSSDSVLKKVATFFDQNPSIDLYSGSSIFVSPDNFLKIKRKTNSKFFHPFFMRFGFMPSHTATFIRRNVFLNFGIYNNIFASAADFDFFVRLIFLNRIKYALTDDVFIRMRIGGFSNSGLSSYLRTTSEITKSLQLNGLYSNYFFVALRLPIKFFIDLASKIFRLL